MRTAFAPAERATQKDIMQTVTAVSGSPVMTAVLRSFSGLLVVVNRYRQIIALNDVLLDFLGSKSSFKVLGLRPGEALHCVHAHDNPEGGCGTSEFCTTCGAAIAIVTSQRSDGPSEAECLLTAQTNGHEHAFAFRVRAAPLAVNSHKFTVVSLQDIQAQKEKEALDTVFFHDVLNTATALSSAARLLPLCEGEERDEIDETILELAERLCCELVEQRDMADLEAGRFHPGIGFTTVGDLWQMVRHHFADQAVARERTIEFDPSAEHVTLCTDPVLLRRALVNMVKNALEATPRRGKVRVWCEADEHIASFHVWNERAMSPEVALRVFQRYFSTKSGRGHGLGTYGMKLIAERYLRGHVCFTSTPQEGTVFHLDIPREYPHDTASKAPVS